jgi:hypothetical protein
MTAKSPIDISIFSRRYSRTLRGQFVRMRCTAKARGLRFDLDMTDAELLRTRPCHYCGGNLPATHLGLDRKDNSGGYTRGNVLPCCTDCNLHRGATWTVEEAEVAISAVLKFRASQ